ncbi:hypothetical protein RvY_14265 [Ramazzottius varieornatus]|uniref:Uncharacterized protein n=1 Tax=Ramazzottius varieornatus TaxID=947166 RepID=A0A1D1VVT0_RAMVA|nr:hypothetical protein RvY_14265 [Ramazzottius varieornatus]
MDRSGDCGAFCRRTALFCLVIFSRTVLSYDPLPDGYQSLSAKDKLSVLWGRISEQAYDAQNLPTASAPPASMSKLASVDFMSQVFLHIADEMPVGRPKLPHAYGVTCKIQLVISPNTTRKYTGVFRSGGVGVIRLSLGALNNQSFNPGLGLKILIDGKPSENFHCLSPNSQAEPLDRNFFAGPFRSIVPPNPNHSAAALAGQRISQKTVEALPGTDSEKPDNGSVMGLFEQASVTSDGKTVEKPIAPLLISFNPNPALGYDPRDQQDFRAHLMNITEGTLMFKVAVKTYLSDGEVEIGALYTRGPCVASEYQDQKLFFQHTRLPWRKTGNDLPRSDSFSHVMAL